MRPLLALVLVAAFAACGRADAESSGRILADTTLVLTSDPELRALAAELLPQLSRRAGLELRDPVRLERRSRDELEAYLRVKLDEDLPPEEAERLSRSYHLLGLAPSDLDLRALLLAVYREQVAGFYDPDSTALFVLDDQGPATLRPLLLHELVHAVQDQTADLDALTAPELDNDRRKAAQAVIEGHATLVMMEHTFGEMRGDDLDLSDIPDVADQLRPALGSIQSQFPELAAAPVIVQESLLFPYLEGAGFVLELWRRGADRGALFRGGMPTTTEQVMDPVRAFGEVPDRPTDLALTVEGGEVLYSDGLGQAEAAILLREVAGVSAGGAAGWDGDRYALVAPVGAGDPGLVWVTVWDDAGARDAFVAALRPALGRFPAPADVEVREVDGRPVVLLRVGWAGPVDVRLEGGGS